MSLESCEQARFYGGYSRMRHEKQTPVPVPGGAAREKRPGADFWVIHVFSRT